MWGSPGDFQRAQLRGSLTCPDAARKGCSYEQAAGLAGPQATSHRLQASVSSVGKVLTLQAFALSARDGARITRSSPRPPREAKGRATIPPLRCSVVSLSPTSLFPTSTTGTRSGEAGTHPGFSLAARQARPLSRLAHKGGALSRQNRARAEEGHIPIFESPSFVPDFITGLGVSVSDSALSASSARSAVASVNTIVKLDMLAAR